MLRRMERQAAQTGRVQFVRPERIRLNPAGPRRVFDPAGLQELAESIRQYGILQPLTVRRLPDGLELVAGERRLRGAKLAGLKEVPCIVVSADEACSGVPELVEQLRRRDLDWLEEARGLSLLMEHYGLSQEQAAARIGKSQSAVANKLRLLKHPEPVLDILRQEGLSERHARALLRLPEERRLAAVTAIAAGNLTVAQTEQYIERLLTELGQRRSRSRVRDVGAFLNALDRSISMVQSAGIDCCCRRQETEQELVLTIRLPKASAG